MKKKPTRNCVCVFENTDALLLIWSIRTGDSWAQRVKECTKRAGMMVKNAQKTAQQKKRPKWKWTRTDEHWKWETWTTTTTATTASEKKHISTNVCIRHSHTKKKGDQVATATAPRNEYCNTARYEATAKAKLPIFKQLLFISLAVALA